MRRNDQELPYLDQNMINIIFENVYEINTDFALDEEIHDFLKLLHCIQYYNYYYRQQMVWQLMPLLAEIVEFETNTDGPLLWGALCLAIKELYGMRDKTLQRLLAMVIVRK